MTISRRNVIAGIAATPIATAAGTNCVSPENQGRVPVARVPKLSRRSDMVRVQLRCTSQLA